MSQLPIRLQQLCVEMKTTFLFLYNGPGLAKSEKFCQASQRRTVAVYVLATNSLVLYFIEYSAPPTFAKGFIDILNFGRMGTIRFCITQMIMI